MTDNACPTCGATMQTTGRVPRGFNTLGARGGKLEPVLGFRYLGSCARCDVLYERPADFPGGWTPA
jgi:hypothetical protein